MALKRSDSPGGKPSSVGIHLTLSGDQRSYALRMAAIGAAREVAVTVFVAAPREVGVSAPFRTLTLDDLPRAELRAGDYWAAVRQAVIQNSGRAFVAEGVTVLTGLTPRLFDLSARGSRVTRLSTVLAAAELTEDVSFNAPAPSRIPTSTVARSEGQRNRPVPAAPVLGLLALGLVLRRRR